MKRILPFLFFLIPSIAFAQATVQDYIKAFGGFLNSFIIPAIAAFAFLVFVWGLAQYFIFSGASSEGRESGKRLALWGVITFVFIASIWGITNVLASGLGFRPQAPLCPDYNPNCYRSGGGSAP